MLLNVFSKPLHISEPIQFALVFGAFIPLGMMIHFIKKQKQEKLAHAESGNGAPPPVAESPKKRKKRLILIMVLCVAVGLCAPLWMPVTGTTNGPVVDLLCGLVPAVIVCVIAGLRLRKL
jgi:hypothetical protein